MPLQFLSRFSDCVHIHTLGEDSRTSLCSIKIVKMIFVKVPKMVNQLLYFSELKAGWCRQSVVTRNFHFWESRNVKKGGELMGVDLLLVDGKVRRIACCFFLYNIGICNRLWEIFLFCLFWCEVDLLLQWTVAGFPIQSNGVLSFEECLTDLQKWISRRTNFTSYKAETSSSKNMRSGPQSWMA